MQTKSLVFAAMIAVLPAFATAMECPDAAGTYLTIKQDTSGVDKGVKGRTLLSLLPSGFATMTDSAQGGIEGYQAFSMMQGSWSCSAGVDGVLFVEATLLDFTFPNDANPDAKIAKIEIAAELAANAGTLGGKTTINIFPLDQDPFSGDTPDVVVTYDFEGRRVLPLPPVAH